MNNSRSSTVNLSRLVVWKQISDTEAGLNLGPANPIVKVLMSAKDTPSVSSGTQEAEGQTVASYFAVTGGGLALSLTALNSDDRVFFYGEKVKKGTNVVNKDDCGDYGTVAYQTERADGLVNLKKFPKVRFSPQEETDTQKTKGGLTYSTTTLQGEYLPTIYNGDAKYIRLGVDPVVEKDIIEKWFSEGDYIGEENANLKSIALGSAIVTPPFSGNASNYTATTTTATNIIDVVAEDSAATIEIKNDTVAVENGKACTWKTGENIVKITVTAGKISKIYTVTVTKS